MARSIRVSLCILVCTMLVACSGEQPAAPEDRNLEETQGIVLLRGLPTLDTGHGVAIVELDPEAENFGEMTELWRHSLATASASLSSACRMSSFSSAARSIHRNGC